MQIKRALITVSDKSGLIEFAKELQELDIELISTGGTAQILRASNIPVQDVAAVTNFSEILDGRVKTLHPIIYGGILARRDEASHCEQLRKNNIGMIDLVIVNLYPFSEITSGSDFKLEEAIENIDIGGVSLIRAAAKNFSDVAVVTSPEKYNSIIEELKINSGSLSLETRYNLAREAFQLTANYDFIIAEFFATRMQADLSSQSIELTKTKQNIFPSSFLVNLKRHKILRYGENPHQEAALYINSYNESAHNGIASTEQIAGEALSFTNLLDLDAAWNLVQEFNSPACAIIKHTNPCGVGLSDKLIEAFEKALATDPVSAFGGIFAFNYKLNAEVARKITERFVEAVIAPDFDEEAINILRTKKKLRVLRAPKEINSKYDVKSISGGFLLQIPDQLIISSESFKVMTKRSPTDEELIDLKFVWTVCKHVKSNAIVYGKNRQTIGIGAGQMSRVDSVKLGAMKANLSLEESCLASDAFFPFRDGIDEAAKHGVTAIIQPGGSIRDEEVIMAANDHGISMIFTKSRHFKH